MARSIFMSYPGFLKKALTLSYDDGVAEDRRMIGIMVSHGLYGTFNINSGEFGKGRRLTLEEAKELYLPNGMEIAVHGLRHPFENEFPNPVQVTYDLLEDRLNLEREFGVIVRGMAYPYGTVAATDTVVKCAEACGILYARTTESTRKFALPQDPLRLPATCKHTDPRLMELAESFVSAVPTDSSLLFYLWGHTYEFEDAGNWNVIEEFAEKVGGRDDIWYCTNGEFFEYYNAWKQIVFSADSKIVYNPTATTLYFTNRSRKNQWKIGPGETIVIDPD